MTNLWSLLLRSYNGITEYADWIGSSIGNKACPPPRTQGAAVAVQIISQQNLYMPIISYKESLAAFVHVTKLWTWSISNLCLQLVHFSSSFHFPNNCVGIHLTNLKSEICSFVKHGACDFTWVHCDLRRRKENFANLQCIFNHQHLISALYIPTSSMTSTGFHILFRPAPKL